MNGFEKNSKLLGYNYNGGINYITRNGNRQYESSTNIYPKSLELNDDTYMNKENEDKLLETMNADTPPNMYEGKSDTIKQQVDQYEPLPPKEPRVGGKTQKELDKK
jgi:hypothetical protein